MTRGLNPKGKLLLTVWTVLLVGGGLVIHQFPSKLGLTSLLINPQIISSVLVTVGIVMWVVGRNITKNMLATQEAIMRGGKAYAFLLLVSLAGVIAGDISSGEHILFVLCTGAVGTLLSKFTDGKGSYYSQRT